MKTVTLREYDVVRVVRLAVPARAFDGTEGKKRSPQVGDLGTVVFEYGDRSASAPVAVESVDKEGFTIWFADFSRHELELVVSPEGPIQPPQHNAGSRPSSGDFSGSETLSSLGPRG